MLTRLPSPTRAALAVVAVQVLATIVAVAADWRTCFEKAAADTPVSSAFAAHGSAISAPLLALLVLLAAGLLARRAGWPRAVGLGGLALVALALAWGAVGEALASPSSHTPRGVLLFSGVFGVAQAALLVAAVARAQRPLASSPTRLVKS